MSTNKRIQVSDEDAEILRQADNAQLDEMERLYREPFSMKFIAHAIDEMIAVGLPDPSFLEPLNRVRALVADGDGPSEEARAAMQREAQATCNTLFVAVDALDAAGSTYASTYAECLTELIVLMMRSAPSVCFSWSTMTDHATRAGVVVLTAYQHELGIPAVGEHTLFRQLTRQGLERRRAFIDRLAKSVAATAPAPPPAQ